jgi:hypothetical protein
MSTTKAQNASQKRRLSSDDSHLAVTVNKLQPTTVVPSLITPHEAILTDLNPRYAVLSASIISSTAIRKRVTSAAKHLLDGPLDDKSRIVLLYARTAEVGKMITVVEQTKRILHEEGRPWFQYNQLFEQPVPSRKQDVIEETFLQEEDKSDDDDDYFEVMKSRFEKAILPPPASKVHKSMRIFLATTSITELKSRTGVTVQSSQDH